MRASNAGAEALPRYNYECTKCGHSYDLVEGWDAKPQKRCPECRSKAIRIPKAPAIVFKGKGFYSSDNKSSSFKARREEEEGGGSQSPDSSDEGSSDGGSSDGRTSSDGSSAGASAGPTDASNGSNKKPASASSD